MVCNVLRPNTMYSCGVVLLFLLHLSIIGQSKPIEEECDPGLYLDEDLKVCRDCQPETYSSTRNRAAYCAECSKQCFSRRHAVMLHPCNSTHDLVCQCEIGYFAPLERSQCKRHAYCPENCYKHRGSASSDAVCHNPCPTKELSAESSTGSTAVVMSYESTDLLKNHTSSLLDMTTSSSNQTAEDNFQRIGLPMLMTVAIIIVSAVIGVILCHRKKVYHCPRLRRACQEQHIYEMVPVNEGNENPSVNRPPEPPHRNASLTAGNDHDIVHQQLYGSNQRPASFDNEVPSPLQEPEPLYDGTVLRDAQQNEALAEVQNSQILPIVPGATGEAASSEDVDAMGSFSCPSLNHGALVPEVAYAQVRLLSVSSDDSPTSHVSEELLTASNPQDLGISLMRPGSGDLQDSRSMSERPCGRVQPQPRVMPRPQLNPLVNHPQLPEVNHLQYDQPNDQPGVPNPVVVVESVYSLDAPNEVD